MLRLDAVLACVCIGLLGCDEPAADATDATTTDAATTDAAKTDAATPLDARVTDARVPDANVDDADVDAASDAHVGNDASEPALKSWRDAPDGPIPEPRQLCERSWSYAAIPGSNAKRVSFTQLVVDARGNLFVAGTLAADFDFGDGKLDMPEPSARTPYMSTFVLALDAQCALRWSRLLPPAGADVWRKPVALGLDAQDDLVLLTESNELWFNNFVPAYEASSLDFVRITQDGAVGAGAHYAIGALPLDLTASVRAGEILLSGDADRSPALDFGAGPLSDPERGHDFNALFRADGTLQHAEVVGSPVGHTGIGLQALGTNGALVTLGADQPTYYGNPLAEPTLLKLDRARSLVWKQALHAATPFASYAMALADDGTIGLWESYATSFDQLPTASFSERDPTGARVWDVPVTQQAVADQFSPSAIVLGASRTLTMQANVSGTITLGKHVLRASGELLLQLERGGAPRWLTWLDGVQTIAAAPHDELALLGVRPGAVVYVRKLGSVSAE